MRHSDQTLSKWCHGKLLCEKWNLLQAAAPSFRNEPCLERRLSDASMVAVSSQCRRSTFRSSPYRDSGLVQVRLLSTCQRPQAGARQFFRGLALEFWRNAVSAEQTAADVDFIEGELGLAIASRVLDIPCGNGRHSNRTGEAWPYHDRNRSVR